MKLSHCLCWFILNLVSVRIAAQPVSVNTSQLKQPSEYNAVVKSLSLQLLNTAEAPTSLNDNDRLFRLQLCAERYDDAIRNLKTLRSMQPDQEWEGIPAIGIQFELMALVYQQLKAAPADTSELVYTTTKQLYQQLPEDARPFMEQYFRPDIESLRGRFEESRRQLLLAPKGKVTAEDATRFCRLYISLEIARVVNSSALRFLQDEDNRNYIIEDSLLIPGADSSLLTAVVVRKRDLTEPQPVVLVYSIYAGSGDLRIAKMAADHGYVGVVVNTRGKSLSSSAIVPFEYDAADSWFIIDYLSKQEYCDGRIGMYGGSYSGFSQWSALKNPHPALSTIVPQVAVAPGIDFPATGGVNSTYMYQWLRYVTNNKLCDYLTFNNSALWDSLNLKLYQSDIPFGKFDSLAGTPDSIFQRWLSHPAYDTYWQKMVPYGQEFAAVNIPVLTITGYYDDDQTGALFYHQNHLLRNPNARHYLVMGPWDHFGAQSSAAETLRGYRIDSTALQDINQLVFDWMDHVFRDRPMPALIRDKVNLQVMGANTWWSGKDLAEGLKDSLRLFINEKDSGVYRLVTSVPAVSRRMLLLRESDTPVLKDGAYDALVEIKDTVLPDAGGLYFISEPLKDTSYIHGRYSLDLKIIPDDYDADLISRLYERTSDGHYYLLGTDLQRISQPTPEVSGQYLTPGQLAEVNLKSDYFTERLLPAGSQLVLWLDIHAAQNYEFNTGARSQVFMQAKGAFKGIHLQILGDSKLSVPVR